MHQILKKPPTLLFVSAHLRHHHLTLFGIFNYFPSVPGGRNTGKGRGLMALQTLYTVLAPLSSDSHSPFDSHSLITKQLIRQPAGGNALNSSPMVPYPNIFPNFWDIFCAYRGAAATKKFSRFSQFARALTPVAHTDELSRLVTSCPQFAASCHVLSQVVRNLPRVAASCHKLSARRTTTTTIIDHRHNNDHRSQTQQRSSITDTSTIIDHRHINDHRSQTQQRSSITDTTTIIDHRHINDHRSQTHQRSSITDNNNDHRSSTQRRVSTEQIHKFHLYHLHSTYTPSSIRDDKTKSKYTNFICLICVARTLHHRRSQQHTFIASSTLDVTSRSHTRAGQRQRPSTSMNLPPVLVNPRFSPACIKASARGQERVRTLRTRSCNGPLMTTLFK